MSHLAPAPKSGSALTLEEVRAAVKEAVGASRLKQREVADAVAALPDRDSTPSVSSISGAVNTAGGGVLALQLDILRALTGATLTGPLYRVD